MINQVNPQPMISCPQMNMPKQEAKNIIMSPSLLMRLFEWCHEDAQDDVDMHKALENIMSFNDGINPLKIDVYDSIIPETVKAEPDEVPEDWSDIEGGECAKAFTDGFNLANQEEYEALPCSDAQDECCASEMGACLANAGVDLSNVRYSDVAPMIIQNRDNEELEGYGASNKEIESFWDGYESVEPMTCGNFTEVDMEPVVSSMGGQCPMCDTSVDCCDEPIEDDLQAEIDNIINSCAG